MSRNTLRIAQTTKANTNEGQRPQQQLTYLGKVADSLTVFPYGFFANVPEDNGAAMFSIQDNPDNRASFLYDDKNWPKLESGEISFYHPLLPDLKIVLQKDNRMLIASSVGIDMDAPEATLTGNMIIGGNLQVDGDLNTDGAATLGGAGGAAIARVGDSVSGGATITGGSAVHKAT